MRARETDIQCQCCQMNHLCESVWDLPPSHIHSVGVSRLVHLLLTRQKELNHHFMMCLCVWYNWNCKMIVTVFFPFFQVLARSLHKQLWVSSPFNFIFIRLSSDHVRPAMILNISFHLLRPCERFQLPMSWMREIQSLMLIDWFCCGAVSVCVQDAKMSDRHTQSTVIHWWWWRRERKNRIINTSILNNTTMLVGSGLAINKGEIRSN